MLRFAALIILAGSLFAQFMPFPGIRPGTAASGGGTTQYFGGVTNNTTGAAPGTALEEFEGYYVDVDPTYSFATCPGTGNKSLVSLGAYVATISVPTLVRTAIYGPVDGTHDNTLIAQGSAAIQVTLTTLSWVEHTSFTNAAGSALGTVTLTGGQKYRVVASGGQFNSAGAINIGTGSLGTSNKFGGQVNGANGYTASGFPATISMTGDLGNAMPGVRAGVQ